jgi:hypothetical protein
LANNPDKYETYHEIPGSKYFFISGPTGVAIHKDFFKMWTLMIIVASAVTTLIAVYTDWWQTLIMWTLTSLFVTHYYVGWPALGIGSLVFYVWYVRRQKRLARQRKQQAESARIKRLLAGGDNKK